MSDRKVELHTLLCSMIVLRQKTHAFHWFVKSKSFKELHDLFGSQYEEILKNIDRLAEYFVINGIDFKYKLTDCLKHSIVAEEDAQFLDDVNMIYELAQDHLMISKFIDDIPEGGRVIENLLADLQDFHDKQSWFLLSYVEE